MTRLVKLTMAFLLPQSHSPASAAAKTAAKTVAMAGDAAGNVDGDGDCSSEGGSGRGLASTLRPSPRPASHSNPRPSTRTLLHQPHKGAAVMAIAATRPAASCRLLPPPRDGSFKTRRVV